MRDDELQMKAQRSLQEFDDAVERLEPGYAELGQKSLAALDEFIEFWKNHPESPQSRGETYRMPNPHSVEAENDMREFVERQLEWGESQRDRVRAALSKEG
jgi:hypothetical protein